jgi:hypothetical protein
MKLDQDPEIEQFGGDCGHSERRTAGMTCLIFLRTRQSVQCSVYPRNHAQLMRQFLSRSEQPAPDLTATSHHGGPEISLSNVSPMKNAPARWAQHTSPQAPEKRSAPKEPDRKKAI